MMQTVVVSKSQLNPVKLPGMGRSIELNELSGIKNIEIRQAFSRGALQVEFEEEPGVYHRVVNVWPDPHTTTRLTIFID
ncbi:MAG TPA: hypothetical protein VF260_05600 [Bacilli bacterium]